MEWNLLASWSFFKLFPALNCFPVVSCERLQQFYLDLIKGLQMTKYSQNAWLYLLVVVSALNFTPFPRSFNHGFQIGKWVVHLSHPIFFGILLAQIECRLHKPEFSYCQHCTIASKMLTSLSIQVILEPVNTGSQEAEDRQMALRRVLAFLSKCFSLL